MQANKARTQELQALRDEHDTALVKEQKRADEAERTSQENIKKSNEAQAKLKEADARLKEAETQAKEAERSVKEHATELEKARKKADEVCAKGGQFTPGNMC